MKASWGKPGRSGKDLNSNTLVIVQDTPEGPIEPLLGCC